MLFEAIFGLKVNLGRSSIEGLLCGNGNIFPRVGGLLLFIALFPAYLFILCHCFFPKLVASNPFNCRIVKFLHKITTFLISFFHNFQTYNGVVYNDFD